MVRRHPGDGTPCVKPQCNRLMVCGVTVLNGRTDAFAYAPAYNAQHKAPLPMSSPVPIASSPAPPSIPTTPAPPAAPSIPTPAFPLDEVKFFVLGAGVCNLIRPFVPSTARWPSVRCASMVFFLPLPDGRDTTILGVVTTIFTSIAAAAELPPQLTSELEADGITICTSTVSATWSCAGVRVTKLFGPTLTDGPMAAAHRLRHGLRDFTAWVETTSDTVQTPEQETNTTAAVASAHKATVSLKASLKRTIPAMPATEDGEDECRPWTLKRSKSAQ